MYIGITGAIKIAITVIILVFVILSLLALLMIGLREIVKLTSKKQAAEKSTAPSEKPKLIIKKPVQERVQKKSEEDDDRLIAVISTAVASMMERPVNQISIIQIKRSLPAGASPWSIAGKQSVMSNRISISTRKRGGF